jgi:UDP-N-acetylglucosamine 4,6-dehydratase
MQQSARFDSPSMRYFLGDVRDKDRLNVAFRGVDVVILAAALKQVPAAEYNPHEFIKTNIGGATNIVDAAINCGVSRVLAVSTDKAVNPINLYGATKLCSDKVFVAGNSYAGRGTTRFSVVRYGNVIGSRGSVIPVLLKQRTKGKITVTDPNMTRFLIELEDGVGFVLDCVEHMVGGEVFVPKLPSARTGDIAEAIGSGCEIASIGRRPGEKLHELLVSKDDALSTLEFQDRFVITPSHPFWTDQTKKLGGQRCHPDFAYASHTNHHQLTKPQIKEICKKVAVKLGFDDNF